MRRQIVEVMKVKEEKRISYIRTRLREFAINLVSGPFPETSLTLIDNHPPNRLADLGFETPRSQVFPGSPATKIHPTSKVASLFLQQYFFSLRYKNRTRLFLLKNLWTLLSPLSYELDLIPTGQHDYLQSTKQSSLSLPSKYLSDFGLISIPGPPLR